MAVSVRMDAGLEKELELAAKRQGVTKSQFIIAAVERALGRKNPFELYQRVQEASPDYGLGSDTQGAHAAAGGSTQDKIRQMLQEKHARQREAWQAFQADKSAGDAA